MRKAKIARASITITEIRDPVKNDEGDPRQPDPAKDRAQHEKKHHEEERVPENLERRGEDRLQRVTAAFHQGEVVLLDPGGGETFADADPEGDRAGRSVLVVAPADLPYEHYALDFDEQTGLLRHVGYHDDVQDWRRVEGVLFPHRWVFGRKGGNTTYLFEQVASGPAP